MQLYRNNTNSIILRNVREAGSPIKVEDATVLFTIEEMDGTVVIADQGMPWDGTKNVYQGQLSPATNLTNTNYKVIITATAVGGEVGQWEYTAEARDRKYVS